MVSVHSEIPGQGASLLAREDLHRGAQHSRPECRLAHDRDDRFRGACGIVQRDRDIRRIRDEPEPGSSVIVALDPDSA